MSDIETKPARKRQSNRNPGTAPRQPFNPDLVGTPYYPMTAESFAARQERGRETFRRLRAEGRAPTRKGVPDGWGGRRSELAAVRQAAEEQADANISDMIACGTLDADCWATSALQVALRMALDQSLPSRLRLKAVQIVAEWTIPKPKKTPEERADTAAWLLNLCNL